MVEDCKKEIISLHHFFESWFTASIPDNDETFSRLEKALSPEFKMVTPAGRKIGRDRLLAQLRSMNGSYLQEDMPSAIWIENIAIVWASDTHCLSSYEEWQGNSGRTDGKGRISSALFEKDAKAPHGIQWIYLHETWIS